MDPALFAHAKAVALDVCRQVAAIELPFAEALAEIEREHAESPGLRLSPSDEVVVTAAALAAARDCAEIGDALGVPTPQPTPQLAVVAEPANGAVVALPGGLHG